LPRPHPRIGPHFSGSLPATLGHGQRRGAAVVDVGCGGGYIAKRFPPGVRDGDKGHLEGRGLHAARGVARSGLFVEVGSRYRLRRTERGSRSSSCDGSKKFSGVKAVDGVDLEIHPDEVRVVAGENWTGKSTSIKILSQVERPMEGEVEVPGESGTFYGPVRSIFRDGNGLAGVCPCPRSGRRAVRPRSRSGSATSGSPR